jgi:hypothetical protein
MTDDPELTPAQFESVVDQITRVGKAFANQALAEAIGSPDIALAILGVAASEVIDSIDADRRAEVLRAYLESFEDKAEGAG